MCCAVPCRAVLRCAVLCCVVYVCVCVCVCVPVRACVYVRVCVRARVRACVSACVRVCVHASVRAFSQNIIVFEILARDCFHWHIRPSEIRSGDAMAPRGEFSKLFKYSWSLIIPRRSNRNINPFCEPISPSLRSWHISAFAEHFPC